YRLSKGARGASGGASRGRAAAASAGSRGRGGAGDDAVCARSEVSQRVARLVVAVCVSGGADLPQSPVWEPTRYHLHESVVQRAVARGVRASGRGTLSFRRQLFIFSSGQPHS